MHGLVRHGVIWRGQEWSGFRRVMYGMEIFQRAKIKVSHGKVRRGEAGLGLVRYGTGLLASEFHKFQARLG